MDISYENTDNKRCFKLPQKIYGNLNIIHCETSALTVLWNAYQIFVYDDLSFGSPRTFIPEFNLSNIIVCNNYLVCLDSNGNVHLTPIKFKHSAPKRLKTTFQSREQGVKCIENFHEKTISFKYINNNFYLCVHKVNTDFTLDSEQIINFDNISLSNQEAKNWIFHINYITSSEYDQIKAYYDQQKETWKDHVIIIFSLDRKNVYSILYSSKTATEHLFPIKLYTCPSEISDAFISKTTNIYVILSLTIGTLINISLDCSETCIKVAHLNTNIYKSLLIEDCVIYTDGNMMWKSEDTFTESIKLKKCFITQVRDFVILRDKLLCTTFNNLIYLLPINNEVFLEFPKDKYCPASQVLSNNDCVTNIMKQVTKSNEIIKKIKEEERYLTILSLSNRYDILDEVIQYNVSVFETFDDISKEDLKLVENIQVYYSKDTFCFLININLKPPSNKFTELLSNVFGNLMIHLNIFCRTKCIKTVSINLEEQFKKVNLAVPVFTNESNLSELLVELKLITSVSEVFSTNQNMWTVLHSKRYHLNSEHFIKTKVPVDQIFLDDQLNDPIYQSAICHFGHLYTFSNNTKKNIEWLLYAKLTENFLEAMNNGNYLHTQFSTRKADILLKLITSDEFLKSKSEVAFEIGNDKVIVEIINDGFTKPMLKVRCTNVKKAHHIRNFFSQLVNNNFTMFEPGKEFVDHGLYSTIEKFQRTIQETLYRPCSMLEFTKIVEKYQKTIIGKLPI